MHAVKQNETLKSFVLDKFGMCLALRCFADFHSLLLFIICSHILYLLLAGGVKSFSHFTAGSSTSHSIGPTTRNILEKEGLNIDGCHSNFNRGIVFGMDGLKPIVLKHILNDGTCVFVAHLLKPHILFFPHSNCSPFLPQRKGPCQYW